MDIIEQTLEEQNKKDDIIEEAEGKVGEQKVNITLEKGESYYWIYVKIYRPSKEVYSDGWGFPTLKGETFCFKWSALREYKRLKEKYHLINVRRD